MAPKIEKLEAEVEIKSSAEQFYQVISSQQHHLTKASSDKIHGVDVHEGDWETHGSVKQWSYTVDGKKEVLKEKIEIDEANKTVTMIAIEGHVLELYKYYKITLQVNRNIETTSLVKIIVEYEKHNENVPPPNKYLNFLVHVVKDIDAHLLT